MAHGVARAVTAALLLSIAAGFTVTVRVEAQVRPDSAVTARKDTSRARTAADSVRDALAQARVDSVYRAKLADTLKAPFASFEKPDQAELTDRLRFSRADILSSGAVNLVDLLDRVPGVTTFRSRWLAGLHVAAYNGDFQRLRIFFDGVERDAIEGRNGGVLDLSDIPLATLDEIIVERTAGEVRVWLRGWTVRRTTAFTRVDVITGDLNTNGFRGLFARRFGNGLSLQFVGQQMATQSGQISAATGATAKGSGDGDAKYVDLRFGWARGKLTADVHGIAHSRNRDTQTARDTFTTLPRYKGSRREAYARVAYGDSARGLWTHLLSGSLQTRLQGIRATTGTVDSTVSSDTARARTQHVLAVGYRAPRWHASITNRLRAINGKNYLAPALRVGAGTERYGVMGYAEDRPVDSLSQIELGGWARPTSWLRVVASQSRRTPRGDTLRSAFSSTRLETAVRFRRLWLGGGVVREEATAARSPVLFGAPDVLIPSASALGIVGSVRGGLYKDLQFDSHFTYWNQSQYSRPRFAIRNEIALVSSWPRRFPKGEFSINTRFIHEVRDPVPFYWQSRGGGAGQRNANDAQVITGLLEIRIQSATLFYQYRNLTGRAYEQIPGLTMPPAVQTYGVRWDFWN